MTYTAVRELIEENAMAERPTLWSRLRNGVSSIFATELPEPTTLEETINEQIASEKAKFTLTDDDITTFCVAIGDNNPIHRSDKYAKDYLATETKKVEKKIASGTHLNALAEAYLSEAIKAINDVWGVHLQLGGEDIKFKEYVHPGNQVYWQVIDCKETANGANLEIEGRIGSKTGALAVELKADLVRDIQKLVQRTLKPTWRNDYVFTKNQLEFFYSCIGEKPKREVPLAYLVAFMTVSMLDRSLGIERVPEGVNREMKFSFYKRAQFGNLDGNQDYGHVDVEFFLREVKDLTTKGMGYKYTLDALCLQTHEPLVTGTLVALTKNKIKL